MILEFIYRRFTPLRVAKGPIEFRGTHAESLAVAQVEPAGWDVTRSGRRFSLGYNGSVPTGIAPVQAFPTTAAQWAITNNDLAKSYGFTALGALLFSGTQGLGGQLLTTIFSTPVQTGFATGLAAFSHSAGGLASKVAVKSGVTITVPTVPVWAPIAEDTGAAARVGPLGAIINRQLEGRVLLGPGQSLGLVVLAPAGTTPLYLPVAEWMELETDQE